MVILTRNRVTLKSNNGHFLDVQSNRGVILRRNRVILTKKPGHLKSNRIFFVISSITRPHLRILNFNYKLVP